MADSAQAAAQAKGRERYESFIETLSRRLQQGRSLSKEVTEDMAASEREIESFTDSPLDENGHA